FATANQSFMPPSVNLMLVLDLSQSMNEVVSGEETRLDIAQKALNDLIDSYAVKAAGGGVVTVRIVTFNDTGSSNGIEYSSAPGAEHSLADAKAYINGFTEGGSLFPQTDYDDAIAEAGEVIDDNWDAPGANEYNVVYFVSDGAPLNSNNQADGGVTINDDE